MKSLEEIMKGDPTLPEYEYEYWVNKTAKLLNRKYFQTHLLVKDWPLSKIRDRYNEATKHSGELKPSVYWWWKRKQDKLSTGGSN